MAELLPAVLRGEYENTQSNTRRTTATSGRNHVSRNSAVHNRFPPRTATTQRLTKGTAIKTTLLPTVVNKIQ
jgi:hypothetical protein